MSHRRTGKHFAKVYGTAKPTETPAPPPPTPPTPPVATAETSVPDLTLTRARGALDKALAAPGATAESVEPAYNSYVAVLRLTGLTVKVPTIAALLEARR